jgi:hypothetical protein
LQWFADLCRVFELFFDEPIGILSGDGHGRQQNFDLSAPKSSLRAVIG